jgi:hypothetical protein
MLKFLKRILGRRSKRLHNCEKLWGGGGGEVGVDDAVRIGIPKVKVMARCQLLCVKNHCIPELNRKHAVPRMSGNALSLLIRGIWRAADSSLSPIFLNFKDPRNRFQVINFASLCSLAGRYDKLIPTRFLAPIEYLKIQALFAYTRGIMQSPNFRTIYGG